jgi:hypothetical protein
VRLRVIISDVLDLVGLLTLLAAGALAVAPFSVTGAVAVTGAGLLGISWLVDRTPKRKADR